MSLVSQTDCQPAIARDDVEPGVFAAFPPRGPATIGDETFTSRPPDTNVGSIS
jgi:hypothetical protein